nr:hypothetical protein CFP56_03032 [Quercus suber]
MNHQKVDVAFPLVQKVKATTRRAEDDVHVMFVPEDHRRAKLRSPPWDRSARIVALELEKEVSRGAMQRSVVQLGSIPLATQLGPRLLPLIYQPGSNMRWKNRDKLFNSFFPNGRFSLIKNGFLLLLLFSLLSSVALFCPAVCSTVRSIRRVLGHLLERL